MKNRVDRTLTSPEKMARLKNSGRTSADEKMHRKTEDENPLDEKGS